MKTCFSNLLRELEATHNINILFACESGSRGWEFPSPDSDYDVRFIFLRPQSEYLAISAPADTIRPPLEAELDVYGWELRKVLSLMMKSNVTPFEWLQSPIIYLEQAGFRKQLWTLCQNYFSPRRNAFHYLGIARAAMKGLHQNRIGIKTLFYVLRPLLAAAWCLERDAIAPMRFPDLCRLLPESLRDEVTALVKQKSTMNEGEEILVSNPLLQFILAQFDILQERAASLHHCGFNDAALNGFFRKSLSTYDYTRSQRPESYSA